MSPRWDPPGPDTRWLVRLPNWIGDAVMVLPALRSLLEAGGRFQGVAHARVLPLYRALDAFDALLAAPGASAPLRLRGALRAWEPDRAVVFTPAVSGAVLARASGAPSRLGWDGPGRSRLLTLTVPDGERRRPLWMDYAALSEAAGAAPVEDPDFRLPLSGEPRVQEWFRALRRPVALAPGAAYGPAKRWRGFPELSRLLRDRGFEVVAVGGEAEREICAELEPTLDLSGKTGLLEAVAVLSRCGAAVTNDSGAMHLARAAGTPLVAVFGSSSPTWTAPLSAEGTVVRRELDCSPCFRRECPLTGDSHLACLRIEAEEVARVLEDLLEAAW